VDSALAHIRDYAIVLIDDEGRIAGWNRGAQQLLGYSVTEALDRPFGILFTPEDRAAGVPACELESAAQQGETNDDRWHQRHDGSRFFGSGIVSAVRDNGGHLLGFVSTVSHELRTPLNAILGWMQLLDLRKASPDRIAEGLAVIERNARAQVRLIDDLLDVSRILSGKTQLNLLPIALSGPLGAAIETVRPMAEQKRITPVVHHDANHDALVADGERLQQVIWNVLSNAIKFTPQGGTIVVATEVSDHALELRIQDSGIGIDPAFLPLVFDRFRQADTAYGKEHGGLGLGLSIVKHLVELHGGEVTIESDGRGHGTTVHLSLPRSLGPNRRRFTSNHRPTAPTPIKRSRECTSLSLTMITTVDRCWSSS